MVLLVNGNVDDGHNEEIAELRIIKWGWCQKSLLSFCAGVVLITLTKHAVRKFVKNIRRCSKLGIVSDKSSKYLDNHESQVKRLT